MSDQPRWHWRNCRSVYLSIIFAPFDWRLLAWRQEDVYGGSMAACIGPVIFELRYDIGDCSAEHGLQRLIGLSENEAYERACRWEGIDAAH